MKTKDRQKNVIWILILACIILPAFQKWFDVISSKPLAGVFPSAVKPEFIWNTWFSGEYPKKYCSWLEENIGFRSDFVRLYNQVDFSLFSVAHGGKIIVGKKNYLFGEQYIRAWKGDDFAGKRFIDRKVGQLKYVQDKLWNEKRILLLVIFAPDKGTFYPEYVPDHYLRNKKNITNYSYYIERYREAGINFIDFNGYFSHLKESSRWPLYPKTGIHWSNYGAILAADSLVHYLEFRLNTRLPHIIIDSLKISKKMRGEDGDIGRTMNLIWDISAPPMAYPDFHYEYDTVYPKLNALFIGDSFYWNWYNPGIIRNLFANEPFWYYNKEVYPECRKSMVHTDQLNFMDSISRQKIIILLETNAGYGDPGYGFTDQAYSFLFPGEGRIRYFMEQIYSKKDWLEMVKKKAFRENIPLDAMVRKDAIFLVNQELRVKK